MTAESEGQPSPGMRLLNHYPVPNGQPPSHRHTIIHTETMKIIAPIVLLSISSVSCFAVFSQCEEAQPGPELNTYGQL